jgi:hypothetical protein
LGLLAVGEKLGILDPYDFDNLEALCTEMVSIIDEHLSITSWTNLK